MTGIHYFYYCLYSYCLGVVFFVPSHPFRLYAQDLHRSSPTTSTIVATDTQRLTVSHRTQVSTSFRNNNPRISNRFVLSETVATTMEWKELGPWYFPAPIIDGRRIAKDDTYLESILQAWKNDNEEEEQAQRLHSVEIKPITYSGPNDDDDDDDHDNDPTTVLYGCLLRRRCTTVTNDTTTAPPAILLFHTAAGPQDVFLYYKAYCLLQKLDCIVMICDILSDPNGWAWGPNRTRYNTIRDSLLHQNATLLQQRVASAIHYLERHVPQIDRHRLAAMGWCLGGQPLLELAMLAREHHQNYTFKAMISFHGVFARDSSLRLPQSVQVPSQNTDEDNGTSSLAKRVLLCNGMDDPFVTPADLEAATKVFTDGGYNVEVLQISNAKHGFTNPAQAYNTNPAFGFSKEGSVLAWAKAQELLQQALFR